jgi:hypothetical protein
VKALIVHSDPLAAIGRITELELTTAVLRESVQLGVVASLGCTKNHPKGFPGYLAWGEVTKAFRDRQIPQRWHINNAGGFEGTVSPSGAVKVVVESGDEATGRPSETPSARNPKGLMTRTAIELNQQADFSDIAKDFPSLKKAPVRPGRTWFLLYFYDAEVSEIRLELSLPMTLTKSGRISSWHERVILEPIQIGEISTLGIEEPTTGEIDVAVSRRA